MHGLEHLDFMFVTLCGEDDLDIWMRLCQHQSDDL